MLQNKRINLLCKDFVSPDKELLAWEKWIQIRKEETQNLAKKTGREPVDLTMNLLENLREDKERRHVLEVAQIEKKPALRSTLWDQPERLKQRCYCEPVYEVTRTRAEIGRPRVIEHVGVPQVLQETEKGLTGKTRRKPCSHLDSKYVQYREKREKELRSKIKKIDPYRSEINHLIVVGSKPKTSPIIKGNIPEITISYEITSTGLQSSIYAIQINKTVFFKCLPGQDVAHLLKLQKETWHEPCSTWTYYFNTPANKAGRAKMYLKNLGTVALKYYWKTLKKSIAFISEEVKEQVFFFNKNENVIFPGQEEEICYTFVSTKAGIYSESWELSFYNIFFFDNRNNKLIINLTADSKEDLESVKRKTQILFSAIIRSSVKVLVKSLIDEIITKATSIEHQIYTYKHLFLEAEIFEMKNPICFYHQTEVAKLKELYTEMIPNESWDLSITSWRNVMMNLEFNDRMKYFELLRKSQRDLLKPWYEGEDLLKQKYTLVNLFLGQLADKFDEEYKHVESVLDVDKQNKTLNTSSACLARTSPLQLDYTALQVARNVFYLRIYEHVGNTLEICAGGLSSLDLNRWIHFDFCRN